ncbi:hypothetical protein CDD82_4449 [Ophiocordyceps australis]|uniref:Uncharacterized protein n=1 Tax=Ophiocordyceps australis TaxID=1399860 RepID=A0A2C5Z6N5_9HYPO|nr:hypothetical protein CDD82_4449 [Ophiocordyceps australis]
MTPRNESPISLEPTRRRASTEIDSDQPSLQTSFPAEDVANQPTCSIDAPAPESLLLPGAETQAHNGPPTDPSSSSPPPCLLPVAWRIGWRYPVLLLCLFVGTVVVAVGHDMLYLSLDGKPVRSEFQQTWVLRIGNWLATIFKWAVLAILGLVNTQLIWKTLRRKYIPLDGIDNIFSLMTSPMALFNRHIWVQAKTLLLLAILSWLVPLVIVVTPATLSIRSLIQPEIVNSSVPIVDFSSAKYWGTYDNSIFVGPHSEISRLLFAVASTASYIPLVAPFINSSYELNFLAPSYKCVNLSEAVEQQNARPQNHVAVNYSSIQLAWNEESSKEIEGNIFHAGTPDFYTNAIIIRSLSHFPYHLDYTTLICQLYNTSFEVFIKYENGIQSITPRSIQYLDVQEWELKSGDELIRDENNTRAAWWIIHRLFADFLLGNITLTSHGLFRIESTSVMRSGLAGCAEMKNGIDLSEDLLATNDITNYNPGLCRNQTMARAIEDLSRNFTYSLMAPTHNLSHYYTTVPVTVSPSRNFFAYDRFTLLATYLASLFVILVWMGIGAMALWRNGITSSASFSTILCTTRNHDLDLLAQGHSLGSDPLPDDIAAVKLKFGCLQAESGKPIHAGFGLQGTVTTLKKGDKMV